MSKKRFAIEILILILVVWGIVILRASYGFSVAKKHMPKITFWEYYLGLAK